MNEVDPCPVHWIVHNLDATLTNSSEVDLLLEILDVGFLRVEQTDLLRRHIRIKCEHLLRWCFTLQCCEFLLDFRDLLRKCWTSEVRLHLEAVVLRWIVRGRNHNTDLCALLQRVKRHLWGC